MTDQTPSTEDDLTLTTEDVRYWYAYETRYQEVLESDLAEFDDWLAAHDRETAAQVLDDLTAWLADLHAKHPAYTDYVPLVLLNIERFRADRIEAGRG